MNSTWFVTTGRLGDDDTKFLRITVTRFKGMLIHSYLLEADVEDATRFEHSREAWEAAVGACNHHSATFEVHME